ncbi:3',5'-cyclic-AMP phosphodiesterase [Vibrio sp.]|uniref:3',5'-cyclic adenosine monophosphate phosphodiesterase CpdA n=1 Tax=Vibrio viridaestus TaxID=2487322 RepID=A0A3N9THP8_9VIBR|nr:3',5'-cyclic-AMP phosphodiesterase [Vibrio viridaestus]MDC0610670.1 3',5'-cyclic-AMP phosphodiesterase [Vibrio sp.]RQW63797.1 3',5'-cyclic-AMP phosphodiesterase [Vibrio viridaestus]
MSDNNISIDVENDNCVKLLQITDTHLFVDDDGSLLGVNTTESFTAVVDAIIQGVTDFDAILATGDISQDHTPESYHKFIQGISPLKKPCFWLPGNHDYRPNMASVLPVPQVKCIPHFMLGSHWQVVLLDSQVEGVPHGYLSAQQLSLLEEKLTAYPDKHTLILLHHHPVLVESAWLDQHTLKESESLWDVISRFDNVKAIVCGHVHQDMDILKQGVRVIATPSTCVQFKPRSNEFALDLLSPGWRELNLLEDGSVETKIGRLDNGRFLPDFYAGGY